MIWFIWSPRCHYLIHSHRAQEWSLLTLNIFIVTNIIMDHNWGIWIICVCIVNENNSKAKRTLWFSGLDHKPFFIKFSIAVLQGKDWSPAQNELKKNACFFYQIKKIHFTCNKFTVILSTTAKKKEKILIPLVSHIKWLCFFEYR